MSSQEPPSELMEQRSLRSALRESQVAVLHQTLDLRYDFAENLPGEWQSLDLVGRVDSEVFAAEHAERLLRAKTRVLAGGESERLDLSLGEAGTRKTYEVAIALDRNESGALAGLVIAVQDVTDSRQREAATISLMREVSHRSKNLLAIVQSVAMQTARHTDGVGDFLDKFRGRLHALSSTQDLVTEFNWRGTPLHALAKAQLTRVGVAEPERVRIDGVDPMLGPNAALHVGLAFHELSTNALVHGGLSAPGGSVAVAARLLKGEDGRSMLELRWDEERPDIAKPLSPPRFGKLVLERIVPLSLGGVAEYEVGIEQVHYRLLVPADQFEA
jgi:two-component sensor histidine kinase